MKTNQLKKSWWVIRAKHEINQNVKLAFLYDKREGSDYDFRRNHPLYVSVWRGWVKNLDTAMRLNW